MDRVVFLEELLSVPSPSGKEDAVAEFLVERMMVLGFQTHRDEVGNVVGAMGDPEAGREIVLLGHMDTVPGLVPVRREGGRLYGRGAVDAKGPLAAFVLAAAQVAPQLSGAKLVVIGAVEEEARSRGARHLTRALAPPDCAIIGEPSGWQGITLGYKGSLSVDYRLAQPSRHGASGRHAPAEEAVAFWNRLVDYAVSLNRGRAYRFDTLDPALRAIRTFGDGLEQGVEMSIGLRLPPGADVAELQWRMRDWSDGAELTFPYGEPPFRAAKNTPPVRALLLAIRAEGGRPRFKLKTGTSDMNVVGPAWGCPIVAYGPGDSSLDHTPDEHIEIEEFRRGIEVLARALEILTESLTCRFAAIAV
ncbi:MAG: [LysW]-lysine hydrolase [Anaerolineae bacterium]